MFIQSLFRILAGLTDHRYATAAVDPPHFRSATKFMYNSTHGKHQSSCFSNCHRLPGPVRAAFCRGRRRDGRLACQYARYLSRCAELGRDTGENRSADLKAHAGRKLTTYEVTAEYVYTYGGQEYKGSRVGFDSGADNIGSFHQNAYQELSKCQKSKTPFRCFVNPAQPSEAALYRDPRWEMLAFKMIFVLAFGGVGFGLLIAGLSAFRKQRAEAVLAQPTPKPLGYGKQTGLRDESFRRPSRQCWRRCASPFSGTFSSPLWLVLPGEISTKATAGPCWA